ncbi:MAG: parallel beta-helix domain-containing protein [Bacteroidota bacterium]
MKTSYLIITFLFITNFIQAQANFQKEFQTKFIMVEDGETIQLPSGTFDLTTSLWLDGKKNITIKGQGRDKTILTFKNQINGAEGIKVTNSEKITIEGLTIQDTKGDCIKVQETKGITFRHVLVEWTSKPNKKNGAYGLYPVMCSNVLIEQCEARGASDAGIYVGQSKHIIVRNSKAVNNVAGIEIENSLYADVYQNEAINNTGGILVFDLPGLIQKKGGFVRVFDNLIKDNNYKNFAPKGNIVAKVPDGTGLLILATSQVEVFNNQIINNKSIGTGIFSYYMTEDPITDTAYYAYPTGIYIHDNEYERRKVKATGKGRLGLMFRFKLKFGKDVPDIVYDGILDKKKLDNHKRLKSGFQLCIRDNKNAQFVNLDAENDFKNISKDVSIYNCSLNELQEVILGSNK